MRLFLLTLCSVFTLSIHAHCQMPCGIYNDQMIYDQVNQYYETMYKANMALKNNKMETAEERNQFMRWIITKDRQSDETAQILCTFFLMQKINPSKDEDTAALVNSIHKLLHLIVGIKQNIGMNCVNDFGKEWDHFKFLFHPEVECKPVTKTSPTPSTTEEPHDHDHDHDHPHDHAESLGHH